MPKVCMASDLHFCLGMCFRCLMRCDCELLQGSNQAQAVLLLVCTQERTLIAQKGTCLNFACHAENEAAEILLQPSATPCRDI